MTGEAVILDTVKLVVLWDVADPWHTQADVGSPRLQAGGAPLDDDLLDCHFIAEMQRTWNCWNVTKSILPSSTGSKGNGNQHCVSLRGLESNSEHQ